MLKGVKRTEILLLTLYHKIKSKAKSGNEDTQYADVIKSFSVELTNFEAILKYFKQLNEPEDNDC